MAEIAKLSPTHEQILNWLLLNPEKSMRECADNFGYTQSWLSQLVHSSIFQAALKTRQEQVMLRVAQSIPEKLRAVTEIALDKLADKVAASEDPDFILSVADKGLHRMGFAPASARAPAGPQGAAIVQQNIYMADASTLEQARATMRAVGMVSQEVIEGQVVTESLPVPTEPAE